MTDDYNIWGYNYVNIADIDYTGKHNYAVYIILKIIINRLATDLLYLVK